jgi:endoglucanase
MMDTYKLLRKLTDPPGPSGFENLISMAIKEAWQPYVDSISTDRVGNLIAVKHGHGVAPRPRILLAAHMDEIGLMVLQITEQFGNGFLRVTQLGGVDNRHLFGQLVTVHGRRDLSGVIGCLPSSMLPENRHAKPFALENLFVDVGLPVVEVRELVNVGDYITFRQPLRKMIGSRVTGKALDNRASVAALTICLEMLMEHAHTWDVIAVATTQEETSMLGAFTSGHALQPDLAMAIDTGFGKGPGANDVNTFELGSGPIIDLGPNVHPGMLKALQAAAKNLEMRTNTGVHAGSSGTDAYGLQIARQGIPTGVLSIALRYMHSMVELVDTRDIERCGRLLAQFVTHLDEHFLDELASGMMASGA